MDITAKTTDGSKPEGLIPPRLTGNQIKSADSQYGTVQKGTIVYATSPVTEASTKTANITAEGYYFFDGSLWNRLSGQASGGTASVSTVVDPNILGYTPSTVATATTHAPATKTTGGAIATRQTIGSYSGHTYTSYTTNTSVTWYEAYAVAKDMGGYLATFTTDSEWQYVEQNVINGAAFNTNSGWIGFAKFSWFAGSALTPDHEMKWITGE